MVWCESLRELRLHQPCIRPILVGLFDDVQLQRVHSSALLVQEGALQHCDGLGHVDFH